VESCVLIVYEQDFMKKFFISAIFILGFASYATYNYLNPNVAQALALSVTNGSSSAKSTAPSNSSGKYNNGTYIGNAADAYYGNIQVKVVISGGKIADVIFLQYPNDRSTSRIINQQAMPQLKSEAIQAQSAKVDGVSGASDSSAAFKQSLASALSQA
jgi:uncharacterized protein with FMN-binding domain